MRLFLFAILSVLAAAPVNAYANDSAAASYRAGDYGAAWAAYSDKAEKGDARAKRYLAYMMVDDVAPRALGDQMTAGVDALIDLAKSGDYLALIKLNDLRGRGLAHSPSMATIIEIEEHLAREGDPVAAWRLAQRVQLGDGVPLEPRKAVQWLEIAAGAPADRFPKAPDAALELCGHFLQAGNDNEARRWCSRAADAGKPAARLAMRRLAQLPG